MAKYTREDILRIIKEEEVEFIRMQFTDIFGMMKNVAITASQIEKALLKVSDVSPNYMIHVTRPDILDEVEVKVEASKELFSDEMKEMEKVEKQIQASIRSETGLRVDVTLCEPESLPRSEGKAVRVIDERNL